MSLNYDLSKVKNFADLQSSEVQVICFYGMFIEMGELTKDNADDWLKSIQLWDFVNGRMSDKEVTLDFILKFVGLRLNVVTKKRPSWAAAQVKKFFEDGKQK